MSDKLNNRGDKVVNGLLGKVFSIMTAGDPTEPAVNGALGASEREQVFISYASPGIAINAGDLAFMSGSVAEGANEASAFSYLVNSIPSTQGFWTQSGSMIWSVYERAITNVRLPKVALTASDKRALDEAEAYLANRDHLADYRSYRKAYNDAVRAYNAARLDSNRAGEFALDGPLLEDDIRDARRDWESFGHKNRVEESQSIIANITGRGYNSRYEALKSNLSSMRQSGGKLGTYLPTYFFPANALEEGGWTKVTYTDEEAEEFSQTVSTEAQASAKRSWLAGLFGIKANGDASGSETRVHTHTEGLTVSFDIMQVPLLRPWFDASVFGSKAWRWADGSTTLLSDGGNPPSGQMPGYASSVLVAKNLKIDLKLNDDERRQIEGQIAAGASVSFGIFSLSANGLTKNSGNEHRSTLSGTGIECKGMQIIGFVCNALPKCPNPDDGLDWE